MNSDFSFLKEYLFNHKVGEATMDSDSAILKDRLAYLPFSVLAQMWHSEELKNNKCRKAKTKAKKILNKKVDIEQRIIELLSEIRNLEKEISALQSKVFTLASDKNMFAEAVAEAIVDKYTSNTERKKVARQLIKKYVVPVPTGEYNKKLRVPFEMLPKQKAVKLFGKNDDWK